MSFAYNWYFIYIFNQSELIIELIKKLIYKTGPWAMWVRMGLSDKFLPDSIADPMTLGNYII